MARKTRYMPENQSGSTISKMWRVAIYIRLSKEDGNTVSYSVENQKDFLIDYVKNLIDNVISYELYIEDADII